MKQISSLRTLLIVLPLIAVGCDNSHSTAEKDSQVSSKDVQEEVGEAIETTKAFTEQKFDEYQKRVETKLNALKEKHNELTVQARKAGAEANAELQATLNDLEREKESIVQRMEELKTSSGQAFAELESGINQALAELEEAYQTAVTRFSDKA